MKRIIFIMLLIVNSMYSATYACELRDGQIENPEEFYVFYIDDSIFVSYTDGFLMTAHFNKKIKNEKTKYVSYRYKEIDFGFIGVLEYEGNEENIRIAIKNDIENWFYFYPCSNVTTYMKEKERKKRIRVKY